MFGEWPWDECEPYAYNCDDVGTTVGIVFGVISPHVLLPGLWYCCSDDDDKSFMRVISKFNYFAFILWLLALILFLSKAIGVAEWVQLLPMVMAPLTYMLVLLESCCSHEQDFLSEPSSEDEARAFIDHMRQVKPQISTQVECYHRERRTRRVRDSKGNYKTETYYVTVTTWRGTHDYDIPYWRDTSEPTPAFTETCNTRLTMPMIIHFGDTESLHHFQADRKAFVDANRYRDRQIRYYSDFKLPGHNKRRMVCGREYVPPWWMGLGYYWLAVILHLTWPYRWKLNSSSEEAECFIVKEVNCKPPTPVIEPSAPYPYPPAPYPGANGQGPPAYWTPDPNAPPPSNMVAPQMPPPMVFNRGINPSLIMTAYDDTAPPTYEEAMGTGGGEGDADSDLEAGGGENGLHSFSNQAYYAAHPEAEQPPQYQPQYPPQNPPGNAPQHLPQYPPQDLVESKAEPK